MRLLKKIGAKPSHRDPSTWRGRKKNVFWEGFAKSQILPPSQKGTRQCFHLWYNMPLSDQLSRSFLVCPAQAPAFFTPWIVTTNWQPFSLWSPLPSSCTKNGKTAIMEGKMMMEGMNRPANPSQYQISIAVEWWSADFIGHNNHCKEFWNIEPSDLW